MQDRVHPTPAAPPAWRRGVWLMAWLAAACSEPVPPMRVAGGEADRGRIAIERYGCAACHAIPGIPGHGAAVGPPLVHMAERGYIAGVLPNTPEGMVNWLRDPPAVDPLTAMPKLGLSRAEAADVAAYLYSQR